eukprot:3397887-Pleurochrysis_carterae.AAC.1
MGNCGCHDGELWWSGCDGAAKAMAASVDSVKTADVAMPFWLDISRWWESQGKSSSSGINSGGACVGGHGGITGGCGVILTVVSVALATEVSVQAAAAQVDRKSRRAFFHLVCDLPMLQDSTFRARPGSAISLLWACVPLYPCALRVRACPADSRLCVLASYQAYMSPEKCEEARQEGNELFKQGKFAEAIPKCEPSLLAW